MKIRINHLIILALLLLNSLTGFLLLREKAISGFIEVNLIEAHTKISALSKNLSISLYKLGEWNALAIKNREQISETRNYSVAKTDAQLLYQCDQHFGRLSGGYSLLKKDLRRKNKRLNLLQARLSSPYKSKKTEVGIKLPTEYDN